MCLWCEKTSTKMEIGWYVNIGMQVNKIRVESIVEEYALR